MELLHSTCSTTAADALWLTWMWSYPIIPREMPLSLIHSYMPIRNFRPLKSEPCGRVRILDLDEQFTFAETHVS